jgi:acylphosphatase
VAEKANQLGLTGYVRNLSSGEDVEVQAEGEREKLERLVEFLKSGPPLARVDRVSTGWSKYSGKHPQFIITG